jgi:CRP-like cAMP-binding protein
VTFISFQVRLQSRYYDICRINTNSLKPGIRIYRENRIHLAKHQASQTQLENMVPRYIMFTMEKEDITALVHILRGMNYFARCSAADIDRIISRFSLLEYPAGKTVIKKDSRGQNFYIIKQGRVEVLFEKKLFNKEVLAELGPGEYFGEIAIILNIPTSAHVRTLTKSSLFVLSRNDLVYILENNTSLKESILREAEKRLQETQKDIGGMAEDHEIEDPESKETGPRRRKIKVVRYSFKGKRKR